MLVLLGKSCSGKTTIQRELVKLGLSPVVAYTTRPQRDGEKNGVTYHFITDGEFDELNRNGFFLETTYYQVTDDMLWQYGTAFDGIEENTVIIGNPGNISLLRQLEFVHPVIFYIDTDENVIYERMKRRNDDIYEAQRRMIADRNDFADIEEVADYKIENNGLDHPREIAETIISLYEQHMNSL